MKICQRAKCQARIQRNEARFCPTCGSSKLRTDTVLSRAYERLDGVRQAFFAFATYIGAPKGAAEIHEETLKRIQGDQTDKRKYSPNPGNIKKIILKYGNY